MKLINKIALIIAMALFLMPSMMAFAQELQAPERPVMIIGDDINYPPYSYLDGSGMPAGFNID